MCNPLGTQFITIDTDKLKQFRNFDLPLINEERLSMKRSYLDGVGQLSQCLNNLDNGVYYLLPLANSKYLFYYGAQVGRMGTVHGFIVEKNGQNITLAHATYFASKVKKITLQNFLNSRSPSVYQGYFLYKLNPHWSPLGATLLDNAKKKYF